MKQISLTDFFQYYLSIECVIMLANSHIVMNRELQSSMKAQLSYFL